MSPPRGLSVLSACVAATVLAHAPFALGQDGTCHSALDCNAEQCYDCSCANEQTGAAGTGTAGTRFTMSVASATSIMLAITAKALSVILTANMVELPILTAQRALAVKVLGAWNGDVPHSTLMAKLEQITNASQKMLDSQAKFDPICKQGRECVGWGVDGFTGRPTRFPIVHLSYDPSRTDKRFNGYSEPLEVVANHIVNPVWASVDGVRSFPRVEDFVQHVNTQYAGATPSPKGTSGIYSMGFTQVFNEFFQKDDDRALSVTRSSKSLISMSLPVDPVTHTRKYGIDRHAKDFADSLPPFYDTEDNKAQYRYFIENYGTSFATSASLGGLVESYASWKTWITDSRLGGFTSEMLETNAQIDFVAKTGLPGPSTSHDAGYVQNRVLEPLFCRGGDSTVSCDASFSKWEKTISDLPVLLEYEMAPVSDLVEDPTVKAALDKAVKEGGKGSKAVGGGVSTSPASVSATINKSKNKFSKCGLIKKHKVDDCESSVTCEFN
eukprot:g3984.t1